MVPCLHQENVYMKRKLQIWRVQKCISLLGAKSALTCAGRQTTRSHVRQNGAENGNFRKSGSTFRHGTVFAPKQCLYEKEAIGMESPKMHSFHQCKNRTYLCGRETTLFHVSQYMGPRTENWGSPGLPFAMVPCLHQSTVYIKSKL